MWRHPVVFYQISFLFLLSEQQDYLLKIYFQFETLEYIITVQSSVMLHLLILMPLFIPS